MAANGISTLASKEDRKMAKIALAKAKRQLFGTIGFRQYNIYVGSVSPTVGRPWFSGVGNLSIDGSSASATVFTNTFDGGTASSVPANTIDGGNA